MKAIEIKCAKESLNHKGQLCVCTTTQGTRKTTKYYVDNRIHNDNDIAVEIVDDSKKYKKITYYNLGIRHRNKYYNTKPTVIETLNGIKILEEYWSYGALNKRIRRNENNKIILIEEYEYINTKTDKRIVANSGTRFGGVIISNGRIETFDNNGELTTASILRDDKLHNPNGYAFIDYREPKNNKRYINGILCDDEYNLILPTKQKQIFANGKLVSIELVY